MEFILPEGVTAKLITPPPQGQQPAPAGYEWVTLTPSDGGMHLEGYSLPLTGSVVISSDPVKPCNCNDCNPAEKWKNIEDLDVYSLPISHGKGTPQSPCIIAKASMVHAADQGNQKPWLEFTDWPVWLNEVINHAGVKVNDSLPRRGVDEIWERLNATVPRVVLANRLDDAHVELRINARLLCWAVRWVFGDRLTTSMKQAVAAREWWISERLDDDADCLRHAKHIEQTYLDSTIGSAVAGAAHASAATICASVSEVMMQDTPKAVEADGTWVVSERDTAAGVKFFELLLDQWEKACAEEGVLGG